MWVLWSLSALAQEPDPAGTTFSFDRLLLTTFQAEDPSLDEEADRLHAILFERFGESNDMISMDEVPEFEVHDYGPELYMKGCPPGRYSGCALVLGQRAMGDWVVGATLAEEMDEFDEESSYLVLEIHLIDVADAREVAVFSVPLIGQEEAALKGIVGVYGDMLEGAYQLRDLREDDGSEQAAIEAARKELLATSLTELEGQLGTVVPTGAVGTLEAPKLTRDDLEKYIGDDERPPWERIGMGQSQYLRFQNSGLDLETWRSEHRGRFGDIIVRVGGGFGGGPWHQSYEAQLLRSDQTLQPIHTVQFLEVINGSTAGGELELGFGVLPFLEVSGLAGVHTGKTTLLKDEDVLNQVAVPSQPQTVTINTYHFGARGTVVPFPHWPARPTLAAGVVTWTGSGIPGEDNYPRLEAPTMTLLQVLPGGEAEIAPMAALFGRVGAEIPIGGTTLRQTNEGTGLETPPAPTGSRGAGWVFHVGLQLNIGPVYKPKSSPIGW